jgi:hypothetical protein
MQFWYVRIGPTSGLAYKPESFGAFISLEDIKIHGIHILHSRCLTRAAIHVRSIPSIVNPSAERVDMGTALLSRSIPNHREAIR